MNDTPQTPHVRGTGKWIHVAGWAILFCFPFFFTGHEARVSLEGYVRAIIVPLSFMLVFYVNYGYLVRRYLFNRRPGWFLLSNLALIVGVMLAVHLLMEYGLPHDVFRRVKRPPRPRGTFLGIFLIMYGAFRFLVEFVREPDVQLGYLWGGWLTMGQLLSVPLVVVGVCVLVYAVRMKNPQQGLPEMPQNK